MEVLYWLLHLLLRAWAPQSNLVDTEVPGAYLCNT